MFRPFGEPKYLITEIVTFHGIQETLKTTITGKSKLQVRTLLWLSMHHTMKMVG
jgi:hypothetical protein